MYIKGQVIQSDYLLIDQEKINSFAEVLADKNPLHIDEEFARSRGFATTIAHGRLTLSYMTDFLTRTFGKEWLESGVLDVKFTAPVLSGEMVKAYIEIENTNNPLNFLLYCKKQDDVTVIKGKGRVTNNFTDQKG